jgi:hypothetical protein
VKTLLPLFLSLSLVAGLAQAQTTECYSWENGATVLGTYLPEYMYLANTDAEAYDGSHSLEIYETGGTGTPQAYVAWIDGLQVGDSVYAIIQTLDLITSNPSLRIWGHWTPVGGDVNSYHSSASGNSTYSGGESWVPLDYTFVVPDNDEIGGLVVEIRPYNGTPWTGSNWVDNLCVTAPDHATIHFPGGGQLPIVSDVYHRALLPVPAEAATVFANAADADGTVENVTLYWRVDGGNETAVAMSLVSGETYSGVIPGQSSGAVVEYYVEAEDNDGLVGRSPSVGYYGYTVAPETITPIALIHDDYATYEGTVVMVQGQVYIPGDYRADGTTVAAYIQDTGDRGLNVFGTIRSTGMDLLNDLDHIVKVSGTVSKYGTTVQITNYEVELVSTGNPPLTPVVLSTGGAALPANEGSYIGTTGPITAIATTGGTNPAHNFTIDDGSGPVVIRVDDDLAPDMPTWQIGEVLVAAGAGGSFETDGQIIVGLASDLINQGSGADTTPPTLIWAVLTQPTQVTLQFSEAIDVETGQDQNYEVYQTANPQITVTVTGAVVQADPSVVVLTLASSIAGTPHTVRINNVEDLAGNPIEPNTTAPIQELPTLPEIIITEIMQNPFILPDADGEWFEIYNAGSTAVDMDGWTIQDDGTDSHVIDNGGPLVINPGEYQVFVRNATVMAGEGVTAFYQYAGFTLGNSDDEIVLIDTFGREVDRIMYDGGPVWPNPNGASMQWVGWGDRTDGSKWVTNGPVFGSGDLGTPGAVNDFVPTDAPVPSLATALGANYPNPFNPFTNFSFSLERDARVELVVFDLRGRKVRTVVDTQLSAGNYVNAFAWDGRDDQGRPATSGTYFYRLTTDDGFSQSRKMLLVK